MADATTGAVRDAAATWRPRLDVATAALCFSTAGVFIKVLTGLTPWQRAGLRSLIAAAFLIAVWRGAALRFDARSFLFGLFYASTMACFVAANTYTTAANAIFLQSTAPLYVLLLSPLLLHEHVRRRDLWLMAGLAAGLALCFLGETRGAEPAQATAPRPLLGNVFAVASGVLWGCTIVGLRWLGQRSHSGEDRMSASVVAGNLVCFVACAGLSTVLGEPFFEGLGGLGATRWGALLVLGCIQVGFAYVVLTRGMRHVSAVEASLLLLLEPVFNPLWTFLVHGERPGAWTIAGGAVILGATMAHALAPRTDRG